MQVYEKIATFDQYMSLTIQDRAMVTVEPQEEIVSIENTSNLLYHAVQKVASDELAELQKII